MSIKYILIPPLFILFSTSINAQSSDSQFIQFMITNIDTRDKMVEIDQFMRKQDGIEISRADIVSKKYLCIFKPTSGINEESFEVWMKKLGVEYKCFRQGKFGIDKIIDQKMDCE